MKKKIWAAALALTLVAGIAVGGTVAWLTTKTDPVVNTFTTSDITITLAETKNDFKMVPGRTIEKDPKVTVNAASEACWLFVQITESNVSVVVTENGDGVTKVFDDFLSYEVAEGWTLLDDENGVYYREVDATTASEGVTYSVLSSDKVLVLGTVTKDMMAALKEENAIPPSLTFTAYAVQSENLTYPDGATTEALKAAYAWTLAPTT